MSSASQPTPSSLRIYFRLLGYLRPFLGLFGVSLLGYLMFASSQPMLAGILKYFIDGLNAAGGKIPYALPLLGEMSWRMAKFRWCIASIDVCGELICVGRIR